jgi:TFIIF-interacting CTD phosphatase-like protein
LSRSWPVRLSVSFYVLIRHLLSWVGIPYSPRSPHNALLAPPPYTELKSEAYARNNTLDNDQTSPDELLASLEKSQQQHQTPSPVLRPTPKPPRLTPKVLVLDLDETLIHSTSRPYASSKKNQGLKVRVVEVVLDGRSTVYTVYKRPWVDFFLRKVSRPGRMCAPGIRTSRS